MAISGVKLLITWDGITERDWTGYVVSAIDARRGSPLNYGAGRQLFAGQLETVLNYVHDAWSTGAQVRLEANGQALWTGSLSRVSTKYSTSAPPLYAIEAEGAFATLAAYKYTTEWALIGGSLGDKVTDTVARAGQTVGYNSQIADGPQDLYIDQDTSGLAVLEALQDMDGGVVFEDDGGGLILRARQDMADGVSTDPLELGLSRIRTQSYGVSVDGVYTEVSTSRRVGTEAGQGGDLDIDTTVSGTLDMPSLKDIWDGTASIPGSTIVRAFTTTNTTDGFRGFAAAYGKSELGATGTDDYWKNSNPAGAQMYYTFVDWGDAIDSDPPTGGGYYRYRIIWGLEDVLWSHTITTNKVVSSFSAVLRARGIARDVTDDEPPDDTDDYPSISPDLGWEVDLSGEYVAHRPDMVSVVLANPTGVTEYGRIPARYPLAVWESSATAGGWAETWLGSRAAPVDIGYVEIVVKNSDLGRLYLAYPIKIHDELRYISELVFRAESTGYVVCRIGHQAQTPWTH